jgi:hypothetical protein
MTAESLLAGIVLAGVIIFLIYLGFLIWTLVDIIKKDGGAKWITLSILGFILPFILDIIGLVYGIVIMIIWRSAFRNKQRTIPLIIFAIIIAVIVVVVIMRMSGQIRYSI